MNHSLRKCDFQVIPADKLPLYLGCLVHLSWAYAGAVWRLTSVNPDGLTVQLTTPKTGLTRTAKASEVCYTRGSHANRHNDNRKLRTPTCSDCKHSFATRIPEQGRCGDCIQKRKAKKENPVP